MMGQKKRIKVKPIKPKQTYTIELEVQGKSTILGLEDAVFDAKEHSTTVQVQCDKLVMYKMPKCEFMKIQNQPRNWNQLIQSAEDNVSRYKYMIKTYINTKSELTLNESKGLTDKQDDYSTADHRFTKKSLQKLSQTPLLEDSTMSFE